MKNASKGILNHLEQGCSSEPIAVSIEKEDEPFASGGQHVIKGMLCPHHKV